MSLCKNLELQSTEGSIAEHIKPKLISIARVASAERAVSQKKTDKIKASPFNVSNFEFTIPLRPSPRFSGFGFKKRD